MRILILGVVLLSNSVPFAFAEIFDFKFQNGSVVQFKITDKESMISFTPDKPLIKGQRRKAYPLFIGGFLEVPIADQPHTWSAYDDKNGVYKIGWMQNQVPNSWWVATNIHNRVTLISEQGHIALLPVQFASIYKNRSKRQPATKNWSSQEIHYNGKRFLLMEGGGVFVVLNEKFKMAYSVATKPAKKIDLSQAIFLNGIVELPSIPRAFDLNNFDAEVAFIPRPLNKTKDNDGYEVDPFETVDEEFQNLRKDTTFIPRTFKELDDSEFKALR
jgi:hypothetical protein